MSEEPSLARRRCLRAAGVALAGGLAGCARSGAVAAPSDDLDFRSDAPCADDFEVVEEAARIELGSQPSVRLRFRNTGEVPIRYEVTVIFEQGTSLGIPARTGRDTLSGRLDPGETVVASATDDAADIENTEFYDVSVSLECLPG
ncbi:hypothetical protein [Halobellus ruber]|uniref:Uncharacterized protein n=1 Tax=Halobellus ruber TaxID=2761102 RepID=A0A7J9SGP7_9EURY|nr:hypothetical protein [Halobellus ruber]MBB6646100.1 hypothetical protein [Halobellus ruber]